MASKKWFGLAAITAGITAAVAVLMKKLRGDSGSSDDPDTVGSVEGTSESEEE